MDSSQRNGPFWYESLYYPYWEFSPIATLQAAASVTTMLRIGSHVFSNDFWHPVSLAREAATLNVLSGGRFELGIGAGYFAGEYVQAGIPFASAKERIARLEEAVQVITGLFREESLTFSGRRSTWGAVESSCSRRPLVTLISLALCPGLCLTDSI